MVNALRKIGDKKVVEPLIEALKREYDRVETANAGGYGLTGRMSIGNPYSTARLVLINIIYALGDFGDNMAVNPLINILGGRAGHKDSGIWTEVIKSLGKIGDTRAIEHIIPLLKHQEAVYREIGAKAIGAIGGEMAIKTLTQALKDETAKDVVESIKKALDMAKSVKQE